MNDENESQLHFLDYWRVIRIRSMLILFTFILVLVTAAVGIYFLPKKYYSKVTLELKNEVYSAIGGPQANSNNANNSMNPVFIETQFQILRTKDILNPVIESLDLTKRLNPDGQPLTEDLAYKILGGMLDLRQQRNTQLIDIGVYAKNPQLAAEIASKIAEVYKSEREEEVGNFSNSGYKEAEAQVERLQKETNAAYANLIKIAQKQGIADVSTNPDENTDTGYKLQIQTNQQQISTAQLEVAKLTAQLHQFDQMTPDALLQAVSSFDIQSPTIIKVLPEYQDAKAQLALLLNSGLGVNHPRVKAINAQIEVYAAQLRDAATAAKGTLQSKLATAQQSLKDLQSQLESLQNKFTSQRATSADYIEAKRTYNDKQTLLKNATVALQAQGMQKNITFDPAHIWEKAVPDQIPAKPQYYILIPLAIVFSLIISLGLAFFIEYLDTSVKSIEDVEKQLQLPVLAVIPKNVEILLRTTSDSPFGEAYRTLRTNIEFNRKSSDANTITFISGGAGEGKSTTLNNLAYTCALGGYNTLIVDADLRRPSQHTIFGIDNSFGLTDYLLGSASLEEITIPTTLDTLSFIPSGKLPSDAAGILNSLRMSDLIEAAKRKYDLVFLDSPPILGVSDASIITSEVDITIMVIQHRRFPFAMLKHVKQAVLNVGGNLLGVVLNNVDPKHDQAYQYYTAYYDYYTNPDKTEKRRKKSQTNGSPAKPGKEKTEILPEEY